MKRVLLTTVHRPLGIESETCSPHIQAEMYHAQVTRAQGIFSIRSICTGWGLEFIAANLQAPTTVLHYPTLRELERELRRGYDFLGISLVVCTFQKTVELCNLARRVAPETKIVLGGYGTVLSECDEYADFVCREEGVGFFRRLLDEPHRGPLQGSARYANTQSHVRHFETGGDHPGRTGLLARLRFLLHKPFLPPPLCSPPAYRARAA